MLKSNKEYVCLMYLHSEVEESKIREAFEKFTGKIMQLPPIVSAVKRQEREREIYENRILDIRDNKYVLFRCKCQHGTYIRKLCSDIAKELGTGGQMIELRRTKAGPFTENDDSIGLDKLRNLYELYKEDESKYEVEIRKYIKPMENLLVDFKKIYVRDSAVYTLSHGFNLAIPGLSKFDKDIEKGEEIAVFTLKGELVAMGTTLMSSYEMIENKNGMCVSIEKVFMELNEYPNLNPVQK
jgi:H/ACA ribonucleoprotein complex subunit 4